MVEISVMKPKYMTDKGIPRSEQQLIHNAFRDPINDEDELDTIVTNVNILLENKDSLFEVKYKYLAGIYNIAVFPK